MTARQVIFNGRVQGVGFRYHVKQLALGFEVVGWVKNLSDGTVELRVMGDVSEVTAFISEIVEESELAPLIKKYRILDIDPIADCQSFRIVA